MPTARVAATLQALAACCPADFGEERTRLTLLTAAAAGAESPAARLDVGSPMKKPAAAAI